MKQSSKTIKINDVEITLETGLLAQQASAAVIARMGDTMVIATVVMGKNDTTLNYFPLSVEYVERLYAGGRIKGSRWVKREGRPTDDAILAARMIDRSIRPLFPKELKKDVQVVVTVLSVDGENRPDILGAVAVSAALSISKVPWNGPIATTRVGLINKEGKETLVVDPKRSEGELILDLVVSSRAGRSVMIEAGAQQVDEKIVDEGIKLAKATNDKIEAEINAWVKEIGEKKVEVKKDEKFAEVIMLVEKSYKDKMTALIEAGVNKEVGGELQAIAESIFELEKENIDDKSKIAAAVDYVFKKTVREEIINNKKRPDGRAIDQIRPISAQVGFVPRVHGSAVFTRGETQGLSVVTLGPVSMEQLLEGPEGEEKKRYMHHYSFPPYSVGETGRMMSPNRREIGHGALAEKALEPVLPTQVDFPYAIRVVSEIMSSNGSTSQAAVCGSTLSLMDAGVPITAPVAGIAIGLMTAGDKYVVLTDIIGLEDFSGDMDFKVAGTAKGITAIQLDVKIDGLIDAIETETLEKARNARLEVLEKMNEVIATSRTAVSEFAPKIKTVKINPEKIGEVIGAGGKTIRNISATTGTVVDVEEDGTVSISAIDLAAVEKAAEWVDLITRDLQKGEVFEGTVKRLMNFGAFVEIVPGKEGLVHVSEMSTEYVKDPADVVEIGQKVKVNVKEVDEMGRINLSMIFGERPERPGGSEGGNSGPRDDRSPREDRPRREYRSEGSSSSSGSRGGGAPRRSFGGPRSDSSSGGAPRRSFSGPRRGSRPSRPAPFDSMRPNGDDRDRR